MWGGGAGAGKKNQYNTKQWLIGLGVRCAERSLLYIMYGGQLMVSVLADKWTVSISPVCRSPGWRAEVRTRALTQKAHKRARTYRPEMRVNECLHARLYPLTRGHAHRRRFQVIFIHLATGAAPRRGKAVAWRLPAFQSFG